jgi:hypothetical protein
MKEAHVQITGIKDEDAFVKTDIDTAVNHFTQRVGELFKKCKPCQLSLEMVVKQHNKTGSNDKKIKYSVHSRMQTPAGAFMAEAHGFNKLLSITQESLNKLETEIKKKHGKMISK